MFRIRAFVLAVVVSCIASGVSAPAQMRAIHLPLPTPTPTAAPILFVPNHVNASVQIDIQSMQPTIPAQGVPLGVYFRLVNTGNVAVTGTLYGTFGGKPFDQVVPSSTVSIPAGSAVAASFTMNVAPAAGSHVLTLAFYDPPLKTPNVIPVANCTATSINSIGSCLQKPLGQLTQNVAVGEASVIVRFGATTYAKIAKPDSSDSSGIRSGYLYVQHNPGCTFGHLSHGNNGSDTFFATKALPLLAHVTSVDFQQFYPVGVQSPDGTPLGIGSYGAKLETGASGQYTVKWNNTCEAGDSGKALIYAISFRITMPQGTDLGEATIPYPQQPGIPEIPKGFATVADTKKPAAGQTAFKLGLTGSVFGGNFDMANQGGTFSAIQNDDSVQIALLPPGATSCAPPYAVVLNPLQSTTPDQIAQLYGAQTVAYPRNIAACAVQTTPGRQQLGIIVTFAPT